MWQMGAPEAGDDVGTGAAVVVAAGVADGVADGAPDGPDVLGVGDGARAGGRGCGRR